MISIEKNIKDLFLNNVVNKEVVIHFPDGDMTDITDESIVSESMSLNRSIMSDKEFKFGGGIASQFKIKVINVHSDIKGKNIEVSLKITVRPLLYPSEELFPSEDLFPCGSTQVYEYRLFTGKIDSALRMKNRNIKEIIAYDGFYNDSLKVYDFMQRYAQYSGNSRLRGLRDSIEYKLNYETEEELINDDVAMTMTLENVKNAVKLNETTTTDVIKSYAELNAAFALMDRYNKLRYIQLLSPDIETIQYYYDLEWEEYETAKITGINFSYNSSDEKNYLYGYASETPSMYTSSDNLIANCSTDISQYVWSFENNGVFKDVYKYRPFKAVLFDYWWLEPGDKVVIETGATADDVTAVTSFVFSVSISGIKNMKITINADGEQYLGKEEANAV